MLPPLVKVALAGIGTIILTDLVVQKFIDPQLDPAQRMAYGTYARFAVAAASAVAISKVL